jgi:hypothetical protein
MSDKKVKLHYKKERVILSDVLPYEVPLTFSNRHFYNFLISNKVEFLNKNITWKVSDKKKNNDEILELIIRLVFGINLSTEIQLNTDNPKIFSFKKPTDKDPKKEEKRLAFVSIPFGYKIAHKENEFRELTICHPRNQLQMVDFYHQFKELIIYYCNISPFSIRKPHKIAKFVFHKDKSHYDNLSEENPEIEEHDKEYENLRSFFVYKDYSNVYKFYESPKFHRCEKRYNNLLKLDISKCFDSIYTHSLSWALLNKESVKENINESNKTFAGLFDELMRQLNYNETNGIIIGPEFSRIFAELILQSVDRNLALTLHDRCNLKHKVDYEIFRYVDDYFIFYNTESTKINILENLQILLKDYRLYLNVSKQVVYEKPIITEITIAKQKIKELLNDKLVFNLEEVKNDTPVFKLNPIKNITLDENLIYEIDEIKQKITFKGYININSRSLIVRFKTIIKECNVDYKDILNYSLAIVEGNSERILKKYSKADKNRENIIKAVIEIIEFVFFIYSVSPRVNATIKLCRVLIIYIDFVLKEQNIEQDFKSAVFKSIFDNVSFILNKNKLSENTQVETLYLFLILAELGEDYWLETSALADYLGVYKNKSDKYESEKSFNYFSLTVLLFYMKNQPKYSGLRNFIETKILEKFENNKKLIWKDTELILLLMDSLTCPYISDSLKVKLFNIYGISDRNLQSEVINKQKQWFISWEGFDFRKELDAKQSKEVY